MGVSSTGWLNPTILSANNNAWVNLANAMNTSETFAEATTNQPGGALATGVYNFPSLNIFAKSRMNYRTRGKRRSTGTTSSYVKFLANDNTLMNNWNLNDTLTNYSIAITSLNKGFGNNVRIEAYNANIYYLQINAEYVNGNISKFTPTTIPEKILKHNSFNIDLLCTYSIYSINEVVFNYDISDSFKILNIDFSENNLSNFEYISHDSVNKQIIFKLKEAFVNNYLSSISSEYNSQFKMKLNLIAKEVDEDAVLNITQPDLNVNTVIGLPKFERFEGFNYVGSKIKINNISNYLLFEDTDIMPQNEGDIYLNNLNLIDFAKSELYDISSDYSNDLNSNYAENKGNIQSLLLDSNSISIKLLSEINDFNTLTDVVSEIFANYKTNLRLKLGVLPNKIISCALKNIEPELHRTYSWLTFEFEKLQRTPYNHYTLSNISNNQFVVNNYQRESAVITIKGSGNSCSLSITGQDGTQTMTINHSFEKEILIDSKVNKVYIDKNEMDLEHLTYDSEFFELKGKCTATLSNGSIFKVVI